MAKNPITVQLPADLPTDWTKFQKVSPGGTEVGLSKQHGYNYLMEQVNAAQRAALELGKAIEDGEMTFSDTEKHALLKLLKVLSENCSAADATTPYNELATLWGGELLPLISPYTAQLGKATLSKLKLGRS